MNQVWFKLRCWLHSPQRHIHFGLVECAGVDRQIGLVLRASLLRLPILHTDRRAEFSGTSANSID